MWILLGYFFPQYLQISKFEGKHVTYHTWNKKIVKYGSSCNVCII